MGNLQDGETFDRATGIGTKVVRDPDSRATPGQPYRLRPVISDELFASVSGAPFGPINPVFPPPTINAPATFTVPAVNQPRQLGGVSVTDPAAQFDAAARLRVSLQSDSTIRLRLPPEVVAGSSVVIEQNDGREVVLVGPTAEVSTALGLVEVTRRFDNDAHALSVFVSRPGTGISAISRTVTLPANPAPIGLFLPPGNRAEVNNFNRSILPYQDATLNLEADTRVGVLRVSLLRGTGPAGRDVNDTFDSQLRVDAIPAGVTIDATYDRGARQMVVSAFLESETTADFQAVLRSVLFGPNARVGGTLALRLTVGLIKAGRFLPERVLDERTLTVAEPNVGPLLSPSTASSGLAFASASLSLAAGEQLDATSDALAFTPVGAVTGTFDPVTGEVLLEGVGTLAVYQQAIRSVTYQNRNTSPLDRQPCDRGDPRRRLRE